MQLLIDLGNSRLKWAWCDKSTWQTSAISVSATPVSKLMATVGEPHGAPTVVGIVSVASPGLLDELRQYIENKWNVVPNLVESAAEFSGIHNLYQTIEQLGNDRWAALVAARAKTQSPVCIIDCGTAITIDAMNGQGEFIGGSIFPGLELLRRCLHQNTAGIRTAGIDNTKGSEQTCQATSTEEAVMAGTLFGLAGAINKIVAEHHRVLGEDCVSMLTGGSGEVVAPHLDFAVQIVPDLVLLGVKQIIGAQT